MKNWLLGFLVCGLAALAGCSEPPPPVIFPTPLPTATPVIFPTPLPTAAPVAFPTPLPTATPVAFPTPLPTATPAAFPTPLPTATPVAFPTPLPVDPIPWVDVWNEGWTSVYLQVSPSVVQVGVTTPPTTVCYSHGCESRSSKYRSKGAGWVYEPGWVVTTEHQVRGLSVVEIDYQDGAGQFHRVQGQVTGWDKLRDIAAVKLPEGVEIPSLLLSRPPLFTHSRSTRPST